MPRRVRELRANRAARSTVCAAPQTCRAHRGPRAAGAALTSRLGRLMLRLLPTGAHSCSQVDNIWYLLFANCTGTSMLSNTWFATDNTRVQWVRGGHQHWRPVLYKSLGQQGSTLFKKKLMTFYIKFNILSNYYYLIMFVVFDSICSPNTSDYVLAAPAEQTTMNDYEYRDALISDAELLHLRLSPPKCLNTYDAKVSKWCFIHPTYCASCHRE